MSCVGSGEKMSTWEQRGRKQLQNKEVGSPSVPKASSLKYLSTSFFLSPCIIKHWVCGSLYCECMVFFWMGSMLHGLLAVLCTVCGQWADGLTVHQPTANCPRVSQSTWDQSEWSSQCVCPWAKLLGAAAPRSTIKVKGRLQIQPKEPCARIGAAQEVQLLRSVSIKSYRLRWTLLDLDILFSPSFDEWKCLSWICQEFLILHRLDHARQYLLNTSKELLHNHKHRSNLDQEIVFLYLCSQ